MIAALFVDPAGVYGSLPNVDAWGVDRDAPLYSGPHSVVAHPPCQLWTNLAAVNFKRYGGEHNRPGNDGGCFASALASVRRFGGVLEHPAHSHAWPAHGLERPWLHEPRQSRKLGNGEWVCEVWQSAYGHKARKRTWLFYVGADDPHDLDWRDEPGTHQCGWFDRIKPTLSKKEASATPIAFRDALLKLADKSRRTTT